MCESVSMCHGLCMVVRGPLLDMVLSSHHVEPWDPTQVFRLGGQHPSPSGPRVKGFIISLSYVWAIVLCSSHCFPLPCSMFHRALRLRQTISPPCSSGGREVSQANTAQSS